MVLSAVPGSLLDALGDVIHGAARATTRYRTKRKTMLKPTEIARELAYPASNASVLMSLLLFYLLLRFAASGGILGLILALLVLPGLFRYLMLILESRAKGEETGPLTVEHLLWFGSAWSLFSAVHAAILIYSTYIFGSLYGLAAMLAADALLAVAIPASLTVLAITRSPLQCLDPRSVSGVIRRCGSGYWVLPTYFLIAGVLIWWLSALSLPDFVHELIAFYLVFAFYALIGGVVQPHQFHREVEINDPVEPDQEAVDEHLQKERTAILNHAYGFISRDNRAGGFKHIRDWLQQDPAPDDAWSWFFDQMMRWEVKEPALVFAQTYLSRLLHDGEYVAAVKVITRCRHVKESFQPLPGDRELALEAAEHCQNDDLIRQLGRS